MLPSFRQVAIRVPIVLALAGMSLPTSRAAASSDGALRFTGVNIAGAEFGRAIPGKAGKDYFYPSNATIDYFASKGMNIIRVPFRWERLQRKLGAELDVSESSRLAAVVSHAKSRGLHVLLDVHNYAAYSKAVIGSPAVPVAALGDLWGRLAEQYKNDDRVIFGLMNEPKALPTETWLAAANGAIGEIRRRGAGNLIFVPGNGWTGAHSWFGHSYGSSNAQIMSRVVDPANHFAYEVHQYLDGNFSGTSPSCKSEAVGAAALSKFTDWLRQHRARGFLGEFGAGPDRTCLAALNAMLSVMSKNRDDWIGWTYWAAGPWSPEYFTSVQPIDGADRPQMKVLLQHLAHADAPHR
jgi:endoglucanase